MSQIPCDATYAPPQSDCLQYFTGVQDTVKSFNFDATAPVRFYVLNYWKIQLKDQKLDLKVYIKSLK